MRIRRSRLTADYVQVPNRTARDDRLSYMARGILVELLSRPDGWEATADDLWRLASEAHRELGEIRETRRAFREAFAELKKVGYLVGTRERLAGGRFGTVLTLYDVPAGGTDVPAVGTSVPPGRIDISAGRSDVPTGGMSVEVSDVPTAGTSERPGKSGIPAGRSDVPTAGTSERPRVTGISAGGTDVPAVGTSNKKTGLENGKENVSPRARAVRIVTTGTGATEEEAENVIKIVEGEHTVRSLVGFLRTMAANGDLAPVLARVRAAHGRSDIRAWLARIGGLPLCGHGTPGGDQLRPDTGLPQCPQCRAVARSA